MKYKLLMTSIPSGRDVIKVYISIGIISSADDEG